MPLNRTQNFFGASPERDHDPATAVDRPVSFFRAPFEFLKNLFRRSPAPRPTKREEESLSEFIRRSEAGPLAAGEAEDHSSPPEAVEDEPRVTTEEIVLTDPAASFADLRVDEEKGSATGRVVDIDSLVEMELPPLPGSALRVAMLSLDMSVSTNAVAEAIGCDPILAGRILRAANSPLYAVERKLTTLPTAVSALGNLAINQLVVIYAVSDAFQSHGQHARLERPLWRHSVAVGVTAREMCRTLNLRRGEEAFLCGLLHDVGKLMLLRHDAETFAQVEEEEDEERRLLREQEIYGFTHAEVGALVARRWNLDDQIGRAIFDHHLTRQSAETTTMTHLINAADRMVNAAGIGLRAETELDFASMPSLKALGLTGDEAREIWERSEERLDEMMHLLSSLI